MQHSADLTQKIHTKDLFSAMVVPVVSQEILLRTNFKFATRPEMIFGYPHDPLDLWGYGTRPIFGMSIKSIYQPPVDIRDQLH